MTDLPSPETLRQPTGDVVHVNNTQTLNTLSIGGKTYQILDVGYVCGNTSVTVLSEFTCLFSPAPYCLVCATCLHPEGSPPSLVPDYVACGIPAGAYGILAKFKPEWICSCLKKLGYVSTNVNAIQPVGTVPFCGAPSIPPPLHNFNPFPVLAGAAIVGGLAATSALLSSGESVSFETDGGGIPYRPGIDSDIDDVPTSPPGTEMFGFSGCPDEQPTNLDVDMVGKCAPTTPDNAVILTIPKIT